MSKYTFLLALHHALSDAISAYVVVTSLTHFNISVQKMLFFVLLYNFLSFATQALFGFFCDKYLLAKKYIYISLGLALVSILLIPINYLLCVIAVGIANALFHVAGAHETMILSGNKKATAMGIYIAPGAVGLLLGTLYNSNIIFQNALILLIFAFGILYKFVSTQSQPVFVETKKNIAVNPALALVILLLFVVMIRSLLGFSLPFPWRNTIPNITIFFTGFVFVGKILGGLIADKISLTKTGLLALMGAFIFLPLGIIYPISGLLGVMFIQMTTAITLVLLFRKFPGYPGFTFGLTTLAIFIGGIPKLTMNLSYFKTPFMLILLSGLSLVAFVVVFKYETIRSN